MKAAGKWARKRKKDRKKERERDGCKVRPLRKNKSTKMGKWV